MSRLQISKAAPVGVGLHTDADLIELLVACHARIRSFAQLAVAIAGATSEVSEAEVVEGCERCERYFAVALPLHVADEERSVMPRLLAAAPDVASALRTMQTEHHEHEPLVRELLVQLRAVAAAPQDHVARTALAAVAAPLQTAFEHHLRAEEDTVFRAIRDRLTAIQRAEIVEELRARRQS